MQVYLLASGSSRLGAILKGGTPRNSNVEEGFPRVLGLGNLTGGL